MRYSVMLDANDMTLDLTKMFGPGSLPRKNELIQYQHMKLLVYEIVYDVTDPEFLRICLKCDYI